jgi:uncharacterized protein YdaU (DUF1376 family)
MSKSLPWFPFFHDDYLDGTADLSLEEQGAYCRLLAFMYRNAGALQDDDNRIAHMLHVQVRPWRRIKAVLVAKGKLKITSAGIINARVMKVLEVQAAKAKKAKQSADTRWSVVPPSGASLPEVSPNIRPIIGEHSGNVPANSDEKTNENNVPADANASETHMRSQCYLDSDLNLSEEPPNPQRGNRDGEAVGEGQSAGASPSKPRRERTRKPKADEWAWKSCPEFVALWEAYPREVSQSAKNAHAQFLKVPDEYRGRLIEAVALYRKEVATKRKTTADWSFKHLEFWLSGQNYVALLDKQAAKSPTLAADGQTPAPAAGDRWAHLDRLTPPQWQVWLRQHLAGQEFWPIDKVGPCPGATGCRIPASVIESMSLRTLYDPKGVPRNKHDQSHPFRVARAPAPAINGHQHDGAAL